MTTKVTRDVLDGSVRPITTIDINGGTIDGTPIGATTPSTGAFTSVNSTNLTVTGSVNFTGATTAGITAFYADLAERYKRDRVYEPGTVVKIGGQNEITEVTDPHDDVFGVIRTKPGFVLNENYDHDPLMQLVALVGRVPCWVEGPVRKGERLYAWVEGSGRPFGNHPKPWASFARSLEDDDRVERRLIEVAIVTMK
jgi:hypothetical protein